MSKSIYPTKTKSGECMFSLKPQSRVKSLHSAELSLTRTLNRLIRSTLRILGSTSLVPQLVTGSLHDNLHSIILFCRMVQRKSKDLSRSLILDKSPDPFNQGAESMSDSTQLLVPQCAKLSVPKQTFEYLHVGAESTRLGQDKPIRKPRNDDQRLVLTALKKSQGVTKAQLDRLQRDVLNGCVTNDEQLLKSWQEQNFAHKLIDHLHDYAVRFLSKSNSPQSKPKPESRTLSEWLNSKHNALRDAKQKILAIVLSNDNPRNEYDLEESWLYGYLWVKDQVVILADKSNLLAKNELGID